MHARAVAVPRTGERDRTRASGRLGGARPGPAAAGAEVVLWLLLAVVVATLWWARDRGFDLSDEGYYLLSYAAPDPATAGATQFHLLVAALTAPLDLGLVGYRVLRLVLLAGSAAGLAVAFLAFCRARLPDLARALPPAGATVAIVALAGLLGSAWLPLALSYNGLSAVLLQVETALVLWILSRPRRSPRGPAVAAALATGFLLGTHAFVKWPTAVVVAGLLAVTLVVLGGRRGSAAAGLLAVGAALAWLLLARELLGSVVTIRGLVEGSRLNATLDAYRTGPALRGYALRPHVASAYRQVSAGQGGTDLTYRSSLGDAMPESGDREVLAAALLSELARVRPQEVERGVSLVGPHRDELVLSLGALPVKGYASHGESWSVALALRLASYELLKADGGEPVLVLDDVFAELDVGRRERLAALVSGAEQVLVTAAVAADVPEALVGSRYDVHDGTVTRVR